MPEFELVGEFQSEGDQPQALDALVRGMQAGKRNQILKCAAGLGAMLTMARVISRVQRPTLVISHSQARALQLFAALRVLFPKNAVAYFASDYDNGCPERYDPKRDLHTESEVLRNAKVEELRSAAIRALATRRDVIVVATSNCTQCLSSTSGSEDRIETALDEIETELEGQLEEFRRQGKMLEAHRLAARTRFDMDLLREVGSSSGIEQFHRALTGRKPGEPPNTLLDLFPADFLTWIDESHATIPKLRSASVDDRSRKLTLVEHGFRLPMALDERPLTFDEWDSRRGPTIFVSSAPGDWEREISQSEVVTQRISGEIPPHLAAEIARADPAVLLGVTKDHAIGSPSSEEHAEMLAAAESTDFERAASLRDRIVDLSKSSSETTIEVASSKSRRAIRSKSLENPATATPQRDPDPVPITSPRTAAPIEYSENVQFTVFRPKDIPPLKWRTLLAFAHLAELPEDADEDEPDPVQQVQQQAEQVLGSAIAAYGKVTQDSTSSVPRMGSIVFIPQMTGIEFNPPRHEFQWVENVHKMEFRIRAAKEMEGKTARGRLTVYLGSLILAEIGLQFRVSSQATTSDSMASERVTSRPFHSIFASYSHADAAIVDQFEQYAKGIGDRYLRDSVHLRAGQVWSDELRKLIDQADIFQLFWSRNSMHSEFVRQEWEYALSLRRPEFVRPTFWETPLPELPEKGMPPEHLRRLHFQFVGSQLPNQSVKFNPIRDAHDESMMPPLAEARPAPPYAEAHTSRQRTRRGFWFPASAATALVLVVGLVLFSRTTRMPIDSTSPSNVSPMPTGSRSANGPEPKAPERPIDPAIEIPKPSSAPSRESNPSDRGLDAGKRQPKPAVLKPTLPRSATPPANQSAGDKSS